MEVTAAGIRATEDRHDRVVGATVRARRARGPCPASLRRCSAGRRGRGQKPKFNAEEVLAYKRIVARLGRWKWDPDGWDEEYSNAFAHGAGPNVSESGIAGVQRQADIDPATGWLDEKTFEVLRSVRIPAGLPHAGERAIDGPARKLLKEAYEACKRARVRPERRAVTPLPGEPHWGGAGDVLTQFVEPFMVERRSADRLGQADAGAERRDRRLADLGPPDDEIDDGGPGLPDVLGRGRRAGARKGARLHDLAAEQLRRVHVLRRRPQLAGAAAVGLRHQARRPRPHRDLARVDARATGTPPARVRDPRARLFGVGSVPGRREGRVPGLPARVCPAEGFPELRRDRTAGSPRAPSRGTAHPARHDAPSADENRLQAGAPAPKVRARRPPDHHVLPQRGAALGRRAVHPPGEAAPRPNSKPLT